MKQTEYYNRRFHIKFFYLIIPRLDFLEKMTKVYPSNRR